MNIPTSTEKLFRALIHPVCTQPTKLTITARDLGPVCALSITAAGADMPRLVGRQGTNVRALKQLAAMYGLRWGVDVRLTLLDPVDKAGGAVTAAPAIRDWQPDQVVDLIERFLIECGHRPGVHRERDDTGAWHLTLVAELVADDLEALRRWVSVIARSLGGVAMIEEHAVK